MGAKNPPLYDGFFSFAVARQIVFIIKERADNKQLKNSACYRLCVCASGSLITYILNC